jgi:serpin B
MVLRRLALTLCVLLGTMSCDRSPAPNRDSASRAGLSAPASISTPDASAADSGQPEPGVARPTAAEMAEFSGACSGFGLDLYGKLRHEKGSLIISPASISLAFAMTWAGARGQTAVEMAQVLKFSGTQEEVAESAGKVLAWLNDPARSITLRVANRLFVQQDYPLLPTFLQLTRDRFQAPAQPVDFFASEIARKTINDWVEQQTEQRIPELIPAGSLSGMTKLVLTNAVYFLGNWQARFDPERTVPRDFFVPRAAAKKVPMMEQTGTFKYAHPKGVQVLELGYVGGDVSMLLVLPDARNGLLKHDKSSSSCPRSRCAAAPHSRNRSATWA